MNISNNIIGRLQQGQIETNRRLDNIEKTMSNLNDSIATARGGLRVMFGIGTFTATVAAAITSLLHWLFSK